MDVKLSIPDQLNHLSRTAEQLADMRDRCCRQWRAFAEDESIAFDMMTYSSKVFDPPMTPEQGDAMKGFPPEGLRLLKSFMVQFLCPPGGFDMPGEIPPPVLHPRFEANENPNVPPAITITVNADNEAVIVFTAPKVC